MTIIKNYVIENGQEVTVFGDNVGEFQEALLDLMESNETVNLISQLKDEAIYVTCL